MPAPVSKRQQRLMFAIMNGKSGTTARGDHGPPKSVAAKYIGGASSDAPESKGKEHEGGKWGESHRAKAKEKVESDRTERKKKKAKLRKALETYVESNNKKTAAGCLVVDEEGRILLGKRADNGLWANPGGCVDDMESFQEAALRELREEANLVGKDPSELMEGHYHGYHSKTFLVSSFKGKPRTNGELMSLKWFYPHELPWEFMTQYTLDAIKLLMKQKLSKSKELDWLMAEEELNKNIIRSGSAPHDTIYELTHGDALRVVGNGAFRFLRNAVEGMGDEDFRDIPIDSYTLSIRKHTNDVYSGRINDGHKQIHQFTNKSLPAVTAELMSVFEWYMPEDEPELQMLEENMLPDEAIEGGIKELTDSFHRHNIVNIYHEMENIREEVRQGMAVDLQQVEQKIMKLFDKLEETILSVTDKHNLLNSDSGKSIDELEQKLISLQNRIEELGKQPVTVNAVASTRPNDKRIHEDFYPYLPRPQIEISPSGHMKISFGSEWTGMERSNFLDDLKAKVISKVDR